MKKGYIKEHWFSLLVTLAMFALAIVTTKLVAFVLAVTMLFFIWRSYSNYDPDEQAAYDWFNRIGPEKRKEVWKKN